MLPSSKSADCLAASGAELCDMTFVLIRSDTGIVAPSRSEGIEREPLCR